MTYSERAYFEGDHCQHCAAREEHQRISRICNQARIQMDRRRRAR